MRRVLAFDYQKTMLYERWSRIASERSAEQALVEVASGRSWSFADLAGAAARAGGKSEGFACAQGHSVEFILSVLRAWREGAVVCPLEREQAMPSLPLPSSPCCHLKFTSATTGPRRAVAFTADQLAADADNIVETMGLRPEWPNLGVISMAHSYGFSNLVLPLLLHGIPLILVPAPLPEMVRTAASGHPSVTLAAVPAMWRAWHEAGSIPPNVCLAISAGAPLPTTLERAVFEASQLKIHNFYGSTECGGIAYDASVQPRTNDQCVGSPMRNVKLELDPDGCLRVVSRAAGQSYWPDPDESLANGRFQTRDLAALDGGLVYLRGRLNDQINVAGRKVVPDVIEQALSNHPAIRECVVFGAPSLDADRVEMIVACVSVRHEIAEDALKSFLLEQLPAWQVPREWWFVESAAPNQLGKVSRLEWKRLFLARGPQRSRRNGDIPG